MGILNFLKKEKKENAFEQKPKAGEAKVDAAKVKVAKKDAAKTPAKPLKENTKNAYKVLIKPLLTEKAARMQVYYFMVAPKANKIEIRKAIKALYGVTPVKVNIVKQLGKKVRFGRKQGAKKNWKKAIISLKPGDKIEVFAG